MAKLKLTVTHLLASPANFLAIGAGSGLAPVAPGTVGTLAAIPLLFIMPSNPLIYLAVLVLMFIAGVWLCNVCSSSLGVHDHPGIVWDEWVGYLLAMFLVPVNFLNILLGFAFFRLFDVLKPWPIGWADKRVEGGMGIMLDDVFAGLYAFFSVHLVLYVIAM